MLPATFVVHIVGRHNSHVNSATQIVARAQCLAGKIRVERSPGRKNDGARTLKTRTEALFDVPTTFVNINFWK